MTEPKHKEIQGLLNKGILKTFLNEAIPTNTNIIPGCFVLEIKYASHEIIKEKAKFVVRGHRDKLKDFMVYLSQALQVLSIQMLLAVALICKFVTWTADVRQAY